jgi:hypothetical protein
LEKRSKKLLSALQQGNGEDGGVSITALLQGG